MRIQHNIAALSAYRNLTNNNSMVSKNLEKLSSGYRINRAGDDAAGLAISEKMRAQITGLETAQKNANDGISLIQTAEGALTEVHSMLNRMVELANQSANGTYQDDDRQSLQAEVNALLDEINRISKSTNFNGRTLLNGDLSATAAKKATAIATVEGLDQLTADASDLITYGNTSTGTGFSVVQDGQMGNTAAKLKFHVDLKDVVISNTSPASKTGSTVGGGDIKLSIGGTTITASAKTTIKAGATLSGANLAESIKENYSGKTVTIGGTSFKVKAEGSNLVFEMEDLPSGEFKKSLEAKFDTSIGTPATTNKSNYTAVGTNKASININQAEGLNVVIDQEAVPVGAREYAQAKLDLGQLSIQNGTALTIGKDTYIFALKDNNPDNDFSKITDIEGLENAHIIDLTDIDPTDSAEIARMAGIKMSQVENSMFKIGTKNINGEIGIVEKKGAFADYKEHNLVGKDNGKAGQDADGDWTGLIFKTNLSNPTITKTEAVPATGGLTLQIGDTSADFNQLTVGINDMSAEALKIGDIDISTQNGAKAAVDKIKTAINTVSSQRGDLGALQNRLEHTINNLSVTTENITAAESRIRDVDVAKEMMAYTKNNILVQSAQAMLAQANQIPQGVLQLLQ